jgi:UDP-N-acetylglucosamine--N-acetylmuramyl-(pentapeptide) pyrophosphoryl-undecaprenol N-acetylglucosamine transferase
MRIWISGGGTGGHVYPALTVLEASGAEVADVTWLGTPDSLESRIVRGHGLTFRAITAGPLVGTGPLAFVRNALKLGAGAVQAWRAMGTARPDVAFVTGGYVSVPVAIAARLRRVPLAVYLPDVRPGQAVRLIARLADRVMVTAEAARASLPARKVVVTGYPVRPAVRAADRDASRAQLGLNPSGPVVLVFGGSQGARRINRAIMSGAERLLANSEVIHVAGARDIDNVRTAHAALAPDLAARHHLFEYLDTGDMAAALAAADLVVSRAGAATLGEFPARGLPAILVPLPIARGHQDDNARVLAEHGAAVWLADAALEEGRLADVILDLLADPGRRAAMAMAARRLDHPAAATAIWHELVALATAAPGTGSAA